MKNKKEQGRTKQRRKRKNDVFICFASNIDISSKNIKIDVQIISKNKKYANKMNYIDHQIICLLRWTDVR